MVYMMNKNKINKYLPLSLAVIFTGYTSVSIAGGPVEISAISAFNKGTAISKGFDQFVASINEDKNAPVRIRYVGGPEAMPPFQIGNAVKNGVVDMILSTGAFYSNVMPAADSLKLTRYSPQELREAGKWSQLQQVWKEEMNVHLLAYTNYGNEFHLYTNKPLTSANLEGQRLRITPIYRAFFKELGASVVQTTPGEVYTALERGVVDGYGWTMQGVFDLGWQEQTRYRVDPGFYQADVTVMVNERTWSNKLTQEQRDYLTQKALWLESLNDNNAAISQNERKLQQDAGIQTLTLEGSEKERYLKVAYDAAWRELLDNDEETTKRIKEIID